MRGYLYCGEAGLVEKQEWLPNSWVNVECPDADDFDFLAKTLGVPESFLDDTSTFAAVCHGRVAAAAATTSRC